MNLNSLDVSKLAIAKVTLILVALALMMAACATPQADEVALDDKLSALARQYEVAAACAAASEAQSDGCLVEEMQADGASVAEAQARLAGARLALADWRDYENEAARLVARACFRQPAHCPASAVQAFGLPAQSAARVVDKAAAYIAQEDAK
jgi:hypothetical protein